MNNSYTNSEYLMLKETHNKCLAYENLLCKTYDYLKESLIKTILSQSVSTEEVLFSHEKTFKDISKLIEQAKADTKIAKDNLEQYSKE